MVGCEGAGVVTKVSFEDTSRSLSLFPTTLFICVASTLGIWLDTSVSFIASEKRLFAMVINSLSNVSLDDRGPLFAIKSREIGVDMTVAISASVMNEFSVLRVSCVVVDSDSNDRSSLSLLEGAVFKPTVSSVVVSVFSNDNVVVSMLVVELGAASVDKVVTVNSTEFSVFVAPWKVLGVVVEERSLCKSDKMSCAGSTNLFCNVDVMTGACVVIVSITSLEISVVNCSVVLVTSVV